MVYPPLPHTERDFNQMHKLVRTFPFAHFFTSGSAGHAVTRLPFIVDVEEEEFKTLRAHCNRQNPQNQDLDGTQTLVAFSGPQSYVSPNWRHNKGRGGTWDYSAVHIWGTVRLCPDKEFFEKLINDLSKLVEPTFSDISTTPTWSTKDAPEGYIDRLHPHLTAFKIEVTKIQAISKHHQDFPNEDAAKVAEYLSRSKKTDSQLVAAHIKEHLIKS